MATGPILDDYEFVPATVSEGHHACVNCLPKAGQTGALFHVRYPKMLLNRPCHDRSIVSQSDNRAWLFILMMPIKKLKQRHFVSRISHKAEILLEIGLRKLWIAGELRLKRVQGAILTRNKKVMMTFEVEVESIRFFASWPLIALKAKDAERF